MWTPAEITTVIGAATAAITAIGSMLVSLKNSSKLDTQHDTIKAVQTDVSDVKESVATVQVQTNHLTQALVDKTATVSHAEGIVEGRAIEKANPTP